MRALVDVRCENGHFVRDVWAEVGQGAGKPLALMCDCGGLVFRADAPAITPNGIPADREIDIPRETTVDTAAIARETAAEIEAKYARFADETVAEENVSREVNEHINDPLPEVPELTFQRGQNLDATVVAPIAG